MKNIRTKLAVTALALVVMFSMSAFAEANHSWGKYHWDLSTADTTSDPLNLGDNLSGGWSSFLSAASVDWNASVIKNEIVAGSSNANCDPTLGGVEVCNAAYGDNGWLGIAQVWAYRGKDAHIAQAVVKLNDTYFALPQYNSSGWRQFVMCQEVGHAFGLDHQDEAFGNSNLGTCMDYTDDPLRDDGQGNNLQPNQHDYDQLASIYAHLNDAGSGSGPGGGKGGGNGGGKGKPALPSAASVALDASEWGVSVAKDAQGRNSRFVKNLGAGLEVITHVYWAE